MRILVLGIGLQGKAVVHDLEQSPEVKEIVAADVDVASVETFVTESGYTKTRVVALDAVREGALKQVVAESGADAVVSTLPTDFQYRAAHAALDAGVHYVNASYPAEVAELDRAAKEADVALLCEMGMDPGIDLVLARMAVDELDEVHGFRSYGAGFPDAACAGDNPLHYKITWTFEGVLKSYRRDARVLRDGKEIAIPGKQMFAPEHIHARDIPGVGTLEAFPNADALHYAEMFGFGDSLRDMGRFVFRWPGHCAFWYTMANLGLLDDTPVGVDGVEITPREFLARYLSPQLQYRDGERDVVVVLIEAWGHKDGQARRVTHSLVDRRDLETGFFAMNRTVGFPASIGAQMILSGDIGARGVLSPASHVPVETFLAELEKRGMHFEHRVEDGP